MNKIDRILSAAKKDADRLDSLRNDRRVRSVMSFLARKGFLISNHDYGRAPRSISAKDYIFTAENFEPRAFAVLPAVLINFENVISAPEKLPRAILEATKVIRRGEKLDLVFKDITFAEMERWARLPPSDKRVRPVGKKRIVKTFRLSPPILEKLQTLAKTSELTLTEALELAISKA